MNAVAYSCYNMAKTADAATNNLITTVDRAENMSLTLLMVQAKFIDEMKIPKQVKQSVKQ